MPVNAHFDGRLLWLDLSGILEASFLDDLVSVTVRVEEKLNPMPHRIVNLTRCEDIRLSFRAMFTIAQRRRARIFPNAFRSAFVAPHPIHLGFARMYQTILNHPQIEVQVFENLPAAMTWLGEMEIEGLEKASLAGE